ncbi:MAG TPA: hypothetical protein VMD05_10015 [Candidatus Nanoarchaeia archaeon]|nr:hypothetical protein [Candidatus Nanoarchaeia archaeon]
MNRAQEKKRTTNFVRGTCTDAKLHDILEELKRIGNQVENLENIASSRKVEFSNKSKQERPHSRVLADLT